MGMGLDNSHMGEEGGTEKEDMEDKCLHPLEGWSINDDGMDGGLHCKMAVRWAEWWR